MFKRLAFTAVSFCAALFLCGCAKDLYVTQVLQVPEKSKLYTAYNIWYENPSDVPVQNYHKGRVLQFGTEVQVIEVKVSPLWDKNYGTIKFKDVKTGTVFDMEYDQSWMLIPMEEFLARIFTVKNTEELTKDMPSSICEKIKRGIVEEGMTRKEVLLAYGFPVPHRTPSILDDTWIYWNKKMDTVRVVFQKDKVFAIIKLD